MALAWIPIVSAAHLRHRLWRAMPLRAPSLPMDGEYPLGAPAQASRTLDRTHHGVEASLCFLGPLYLEHSQAGMLGAKLAPPRLQSEVLLRAGWK